MWDANISAVRKKENSKKNLPLGQFPQEETGMQKIICARIGIEGLAPVMVHANQSSVEDDG